MKLCLFLLPAVLSASPLMEPVPVASTSCSVARTPVECAPPSNVFGIYGSERSEAHTSVSILGLGTDDLYIDVYAEAVAGSSDFSGLGIGSSSLATVSLDFFGATDGPARQGFADFAIFTDQEWGSSGGSGASVSIAGLGSCGVQCEKVGTRVPFELGVPFEITMNLFASGGTGQHTLSGGLAETIIKLKLFDGVGPVAIFDPPRPTAPRPTPEPGTRGLIAAGVLACLFLRQRAVRQLR